MHRVRHKGKIQFLILLALYQCLQLRANVVLSHPNYHQELPFLVFGIQLPH